MERIPQARDRSSGSRWTQCRIVVNTTLLWTLRIVSQLLVLVGVAVLFYGLVRFAGGPIVAAHGRYYGDGQPAVLRRLPRISALADNDASRLTIDVCHCRIAVVARPEWPKMDMDIEEAGCRII